MEFVTAVNRSSQTLKATWDGKRYLLKPNQKVSLPSIVAKAAKLQNPIMGSEDPNAMNLGGLPEMQYLVGVEEWNDDCSPVEQSGAIERFDRTQLDEVAATAQVIPAKGGVVRSVANASLPLDSAFVDPTV